MADTPVVSPPAPRSSPPPTPGLPGSGALGMAPGREHAVFFTAPDGSPGVERFAALPDAVARVEALANADVRDAAVFALLPVPLQVRQVWRVEVDSASGSAAPLCAPVGAPITAPTTAPAAVSPAPAAPVAPAAPSSAPPAAPPAGFVALPGEPEVWTSEPVEPAVPRGAHELSPLEQPAMAAFEPAQLVAAVPPPPEQVPDPAGTDPAGTDRVNTDSVSTVLPQPPAQRGRGMGFFVH